MIHHEDCIISPDEGRLWGEEGGGGGGALDFSKIHPPFLYFC